MPATTNRQPISSAQTGLGPLPYIVLALGVIVILWWMLEPRPGVHTAQTSAPSDSSLSLPSGEITSGGPTPSVPNASLTPGDVLTTETKTICTPGYTQTVRNVPSDLKKAVYNEYGIPTHKPGAYEVDHLISLELGGSNSARNLWPESYLAKPLNAHVKDELENKLHALVCSGQLPIGVAQQAIAQNWPAAYQQYVGTLPR